MESLVELDELGVTRGEEGRQPVTSSMLLRDADKQKSAQDSFFSCERSNREDKKTKRCG